MHSPFEPPPSAQRSGDGVSPVPQGNEIVPYHPSNMPETRSQVERIRKADSGDIQAGLELISLNSAEALLANRFCKHQPDRSILSCLQDAKGTAAPYQIAMEVLDEFAEQSQETASDCMSVFRYIQEHKLWKGHPNPDVRSAEDLLPRLNGGKYIYANLVVGASTQSEKRNRIQIIESVWGDDWFQEIDESMRKPGCRQAEDLSLALLTEIAANAKQGILRDDAVTRWKSAIHDRGDFGRRRELKSRAPTVSYLLPMDVASLNLVERDEDKGKRTSDMFFPNDAKEHDFRVELVPPASTTAVISSKPSYSTGGRSQPTRKRKRNKDSHNGEQRPDARDIPSDEEGWTLNQDGTRMTKQVRNHFISKPVDQPATSLAPIPDQTGTQTRSPLPISSAVEAYHEDPTCDGPGVAHLLRKVLEAFVDIQDPACDATVVDNCCDNCQTHVLNIVRCLREKLLPSIASLEGVSRHVSGEEEISASQHDDISPCKRRRAHATRRIVEDSDGD